MAAQDWLGWLFWSVLFIWLVLYNQTNETNQINQITVCFILLGWPAHGVPHCTDQKVRTDPCLTSHGQQPAPTYRGHCCRLPCRWSRRHIHRGRRAWPVAGLHGHHPRLRIIGGCKCPRCPTLGRSPHQRRRGSRHASPRIGRDRVLHAHGTWLVPESCHHGTVRRGERRHHIGPSLFEPHLSGHSLRDLPAGPLFDYARHRRHQNSDVRLDCGESLVSGNRLPPDLRTLGLPCLGHHRSSRGNGSGRRNRRGLPSLGLPNTLSTLSPRPTRSSALHLANRSVCPRATDVSASRYSPLYKDRPRIWHGHIRRTSSRS